MNLLLELQSLPSDWRLVRVGRSKQPISGDGWFDVDDFSPDDAAALNVSMPPAWGVKSGPASGGIVILDLDSPGWDESFQAVTGHPFSDLPTTISWTSGKPQRSGHAFQVDEDWWEHLANRRYWSRPWREGDPLDKNGERKPVTLWELRWDRHQSVIIGAHPETGRYRWLEGCSPAELGDPAPAPDWLLEALVVQELPEAKPFKASDGDGERAVAMLQCIPAADYASYDAWLRIGMALHHTDAGLLSEWVEWCKGMGASFDEAECLRKWESFGRNGYRGRPATIATLHHIAKQHRYVEPKRKRERSAKGKAVLAESTLTTEGKSGELGELIGGDGRATSEEKAAEDKPWPFALLGFAGDNFFYQPGESGQITAIAGAKHSSTQMLRLARLDWWLKHYPRKNDDGDTVGVNWQQAYDNLFERQYQVGYFDPDNVRGLGAWWDDGRTVLHLGDRLIVDGKAHPLNKALKSDYIYQRLRRLKGPSAAKPLSADEAMQVLETAGSFMWEEKPSAFLLAGWVALAPICGALRWRPHIWLTAGPGSGKSTIIERFVNVLIGDMGVHPEGQATEASIRQELVSSALPIVYDEADPNERSDRARLQAILSFARSCSSEGRGRIMKGSSDQSGAKKYQPKSMFLLSSVATALKQGADKSRFAQLTLRRDEKKTKAELESHWKQLDAALSATITDEFAKRLIARTIALIPMIRAAAEIFVVAAAGQLGSQRLGDQYGTLAAGAWSLQYEHVPSPEEARDWLQRNPLTSYADSTEVSDEKSCLETILEHQVRFDVDKGVKTVTVLTLIGIATQVPSLAPSGEDPITKDTAKRALGGVGIRVGDDGRLQISNTAKALRKLLADTSWENCWPTVLSRMEGATKEDKPKWFPGIGASRCVSLPMPALDDAGGDE